MPTEYAGRVLEPPISEWPLRNAQPGDSWLETLRTAARRRLILMAQQYRQTLEEIARTSGWQRLPGEPLSGDPDAVPIVMTGHQPVIFHSGLTFKYETTEEFAVANQAIGVAIVIDTDEGDAGEFSYPERAASDSSIVDADSCMALNDWPQVLTAHASFGTGPSSYSASRKKSAKDLRDTTAAVMRGLQSCGCNDSAVHFSRRAEQYASLQTDSMMEANVIIRWHSGIGSRMLELPLSALCGIPETVRFFAEILSRPFEFATCYNETLNTYRAEHKIRNEANPFPNLQFDDSQTELPFWIVDTKAGARSVVRVRRQGIERVLETATGFRTELIPGNEAATIFSLLVSGQQLIPRGALITATLRLLFSDLFVHGTGGGRYDKSTDHLIRSWWKAEPTPFTVASASRYLFAPQRAQVSHLQTIADRMRDLQFNPQRHFGTGVFSSVMEDQLRQKLATRDNAVKRLKESRERGESAKDIGQEIQWIADDIKAFVVNRFSPQLEALNHLSADTLATWNNRTWPWLFF